MSDTGPVKHPPVPTDALKSRIHDFAEQAVDVFKVSVGEPLESLVTRLGGAITHGDIAKIFSEGEAPPSITVRGPRDFTIELPLTSSHVRNRFTIAHELGHLFLHYPMVQRKVPGAWMIATRWVDETDPRQQRAEWEANWFAAAFLMPRRAFLTAWEKSSGDVDQVAVLLQVSSQAAKIRAQTLGLGA